MTARKIASRSAITLTAGVLLTMMGSGAPAQAQDFFRALFGGFNMRPAPRVEAPMPPIGYGSNSDEMVSRPRVQIYGGGTAYCVRTCDGRYFPAPVLDRASRAATCKSFCPASETAVYYGGSIDDAVSDRGKSYSDSPNAFRYRDEMVAGCTCNGGAGLAPVKIEDDPTLRSGDIVAGENGLLVARRSDGRGTPVNFSPAAPSVQAKFQRPRIMARE